MNDILKLNATEAATALQKGDISSVELTSAYVAAADATSALNNYVALCADKAIEMAQQSDKRRANQKAGPLEGLPIGIKDLFCTSGVETTACSSILKGFVPSYESSVTEKLWAAGGVMLV